MFNELVSTGNFARISEKGSCTSITSTGVHAVIVSSGDMATVSAKTGSMVTLSEYAFDENGEYSIKGVKTAYIDGERIKGDTPYQLVDGEFKKQ
jgi:transcription elongation GreA/GreB family factor